MKYSKDSNLRKINNVFTTVVVVLALYIVLAPFLPNFWWSVRHLVNKPKQSEVQIVKGQPSSNSSKSIPSGYWLDIPRLDMHEQIYTGLSIAELNKGVWHIAGTSTPDKGGNTVVAGHRFTYVSPRGVFYYLDKIQTNDKVSVDWLGTEYTYRVSNIEVVPPTDPNVEAATKDAHFTLYTCTPLLTAKNRLVVQTELVSKRSS